MQRFVTIGILGLLIGLTGAMPADFYATKYDHIDVETILNNRRMVNYYAACMLSKGPCPPEGLEFKRILPEALQTNCEKCTEKQRTITLRAIKRLKKEYPKVWAQLAELWDPDGTNFEKFEASFGVTTPATAPQLINRFGDEDSDTSNVIKEVASTTSTTTTSTTTTTRPYASASNTTSTSPVTNISTNLYTTSTIKASTTNSRPTANVGGFQTTVSFGTNLVGGLVRGLSNLGNRVVETGQQIANVVIRGVARVVRPL